MSETTKKEKKKKWRHSTTMCWLRTPDQAQRIRAAKAIADRKFPSENQLKSFSKWMRSFIERELHAEGLVGSDGIVTDEMVDNYIAESNRREAERRLAESEKAAAEQKQTNPAA
jgi:hypothetical protein